jgi:flavin-dependent dehydrogenase
VGTEIVEQVTGQYLGIGAGASVKPDLRDRVFLVGDAGGFVDALTGEGIYGALLSGQAAASAILSHARARVVRWMRLRLRWMVICKRYGSLPGRQRHFMQTLRGGFVLCASLSCGSRWSRRIPMG